MSQTSSSTNSSRIQNQLTQTELVQLVRDLELRAAYHERLNQDLSDQVYALHRQVEILQAQLTHLTKRLEGTAEGTELGPANDPPPHY